MTLAGKTVRLSLGKVVIGHGHSKLWRDLKDFLVERLGLQPDEFNIAPTAGMTTQERLEQMLDDAAFAFLLMTGEDEHADDAKTHARENVVHEIGLFQGRLGFRKAIVLLEDGCAEFSNIVGLGQIRFPKGDLRPAQEEIRRVLEREGLL
jgi:predicted nucleotide-binding protein